MSGGWLWLLGMAFVILGRLLGLPHTQRPPQCFPQDTLLLSAPDSCGSRLRVCYEMPPLPWIRLWKTDVVQLSGKSKSEPWVESQSVSSVLVTYSGLDEPCTSL